MATVFTPWLMEAKAKSGTLTAQDTTNYNNYHGIANQQQAQATQTPQTGPSQSELIAQAQRAQTLKDALAQLKTTSEAQLTATVNPYKTAQAAIPGQTTVQNNAASSQGMVNAQKIRQALSQMNLLQSGESPSQQLLNDTTVANEQNANTLAGQQLDASYNDKIALATAQNATDYNNTAYQYGRDANADSQWAQTFEYAKSQDAIKNAQNQQQLDNQVSQFAQTFGLSQSQFAESIKQNGIQNAYNDKTFAQRADEFAQTMGLNREQFQAGLDQWSKTFSYNESQDAIKNAQTDAALAASVAKANSGGGYYGGASNATQGKSNALSDAYQAVDSALSSGTDPDAVLANIQNSYADFARSGLSSADIQNILNYYEQRKASYLGLETTPGQL